MQTRPDKKDLKKGYQSQLQSFKKVREACEERLEKVNTILQASNKKMKAGNMGLKSAYAELKIAYNELQAINDNLSLQENALTKSDANFRALLSNNIQAFILLDPAFNVIAFNEVAQKVFNTLFGGSIEIGRPYHELLLADPGNYLSEALRQAFKGKYVVKEQEICNVKGDLYSYKIGCTPVFDESKKLLSISLSLLDLTESKKTREALIKSQELIHSVFHTADIGIALIDARGRFVKTNRGYDKLFGFNVGELEGKNYTIIVPKGKKSESRQLFSRFLSGDKVDGQRMGIKKNGELVSVYRTVNTMKNAAGDSFLVVTARDISETVKYQSLLQYTEEIGHIAGWEMDVATRAVTGTAEMFEILEISEVEFSALSFRKKLEHFLGPQNRAMVNTAIEAAIAKAKPFDIEAQIITNSKIKKWIRITCNPEPKKLHPLILRGLIQDITRNKENEMELERLSLVASKTSNAVIITDDKGKTIWVNKSFERLTGYTAAEIFQKKPGELLQGPGTDKATVRRMSLHIKRKEGVTELIKNYRKDGSEIWMNMDIAPVFKNDALINFIGVGIDVTELMNVRKIEKAKELLEQQQKLFTSIARNFPDGIIGVLNKSFHYIFVGGSEISRLGLSDKDFLGSNLFDHISDKSNDEAKPFLEKAIQGENVVFEGGIKGNIYTINLVPLFGLNGTEVQQILVVIYNITHRKNAEKNLLETLNKEKELGDLKSRFVSMASHEFRTPLSTVLSSAYLLERYITAEEQPKRMRHLQRIVSAVETLTEILNDFLSLGKIEEGKIQVKFSEFNIEELIGNIINDIRDSMHKGQNIHYTHQGNPMVYLEPALLKHIVLNLISNAIKFTQENAEIVIKTTILPTGIILSVKDNGIGISIEDQKHLTERFFRGSNAGNIQGTGLGLHLVAKYAELMNGKIICNSVLGAGTEFIINFESLHKEML